MFVQSLLQRLSTIRVYNRKSLERQRKRRWVLETLEDRSLMAVLVGFDVGNQTGYGTDHLAPAVVATGLTSNSGLTRGTSLGSTAGNPGNGVWGGYYPNSFVDLGEGTNDNTYLSFSFTVSPTFSASLTSIDLTYARDSNGPQGGTWAYSLDSTGTFTTINTPAQNYAVTTSGNIQLTLSGETALQNIPSGTLVTLKLSMTSRGTFDDNHAADKWLVKNRTDGTVPDLIVNGSATATPTLSVVSSDSLVSTLDRTYSSVAYVGAKAQISPATLTPVLEYYPSNTLANQLSAAPTDVGTYWVRAVWAGNVSYLPVSTSLVAFSITPKQLTVTNLSVATKQYDATTTATVTGTISGVFSSDSANVSLVGSFANVDAAAGKTVSVSLGGSRASQYAYTQSTTGTIAPRVLTVTGTAADRTYDGTTNVSVSYSGLSNAIASDLVTVSSPVIGTVSNKDAGNGKTVTLPSPVLSGGASFKAGNYSLAAPTGLTVNIGKVSLTATVSAADKVYDQNAVAQLTYSNFVGFIGSETVTVSSASSVGTFNSADAGSNRSVTAATPVLVDGAVGGKAINYSLGTPTGLLATISPKQITATVSASNKVYDGTDVAALSYVFNGLLGSETLTVSVPSTVGAFVSVDVATGIDVNVLTTQLNDGSFGGKASNYSLSSVSAPKANITPLALTANFVALNKTYDQTRAANLSYSGLSGFVGSQTVTVDPSSLVGTFASADASSAITVSANTILLLDGAAGGKASNYSIATPVGLTASILPKAIDATVTATNKTYDGTNAAQLSYAFSGVIGSETLTVTAASTVGAFETLDVGSNINVSVPVTVLADGSFGGKASNYSLNSVISGKANITARPLTAVFSGLDRTYDRTSNAQLSYSGLSGFAGSETVFIVPGSLVGTFATANAGNGISITPGVITLSDGANGGKASNYVLTQPTGVAANINKLGLSSSVTVANKMEDGSTAATITSRTLSGVLAGDSVTLVGGTANFDSASFGNGKTVTVTGLNLAGPQSGNYSIVGTATTTADVAKLITFEVIVNGADSFANKNQRSEVTSLKIRFSDIVVLDSGAFTIANIGLVTAQAPVNVGQLNVTSSVVEGATTVIITFGGLTPTTGVVNRLSTSNGAGLGNSLSDGAYVVTINQSKARTTTGINLAGNNQFGTRSSDNFFRMFGDSDGNGAVDGLDFLAIRKAVSSVSTTNPEFDVTGDGKVDATDSTVFNANLLKRRRVF